MSEFIFAFGIIFYIAASRLAMRLLRGAPREVVLGLLNAASVFYFLIYAIPTHTHKSETVAFVLYLLIVIFQYVMLAFFSEARRGLSWIAFFAPIAVLVFIRYVPLSVYVTLAHALGKQLYNHPGALMVGLSYLAFRCSRLVLEIQNGLVKRPGFWEYLNFSFFLPTMSVGPINTYANFRRGFEEAPMRTPVGQALLRCLLGFVKFKFLGSVVGQISYSGFLLNGHPHSWVALPIVMVCYFIYLYCNFSGYCDMAIGTAALIGIPVLENFDNPFAARNVKEFWNRWHITLSQWMRDIVFAPLSKFLVRLMGAARVNHAIAIAIFVVFLLIGVWHGVGWNYAIFGLFQAIGVVANHYYTIGLKKWLGRDGFKAYNENRWIRALAVVSTFCYYSASLLFFANSLGQVREILQTLR
jgi:D-alanyl-lipoteichoic acid acyltransferase DltB (MBOAT superfamily)